MLDGFKQESSDILQNPLEAAVDSLNRGVWGRPVGRLAVGTDGGGLG